MDYHPDDWLAREGMTNIGVGVSVTMGLRFSIIKTKSC